MRQNKYYRKEAVFMTRRIDMTLYLNQLKKRYKEASKKDKSLILNEFCSTSGYHRKHAITLLSQAHHSPDKNANPDGRGRKKIYAPEPLLAPLKQIWLATNQMCGKRLKAAMPIWLPFYEKTYGEMDEKVKEQLLAMSESTIDRLLHAERVRFPKRLGGTKPGSLLKKHIPIKTDQWNESQPGFVEADTVAHCGESLLGDFAWSITLTDIYSGWTENRAVWGKGARGVVEQIRDIENHLIFPILGFDSDNGSEFLNYHFIRYFQEREQPAQFTRSRPYHKDDNAHVEQKNWTHVRQLFGYYRIENKTLIAKMNDLYKNECSLLQNYFYPTMKLIDKCRVQSKIIKKHGKAQTPYQRLMTSEHIDLEQKEKLKATYEKLNPFELKAALEDKLKSIFLHVDVNLKGRSVAI